MVECFFPKILNCTDDRDGEDGGSSDDDDTEDEFDSTTPFGRAPPPQATMFPRGAAESGRGGGAWAAGFPWAAGAAGAGGESGRSFGLVPERLLPWGGGAAADSDDNDDNDDNEHDDDDDDGTLLPVGGRRTRI